MNLQIKDKFIKLWKEYFNDYDLPITYYYTNEISGEVFRYNKDFKGRDCFINHMREILKGQDLIFDKKSLRCPGAIYYTGFGELTMPNFEYFLSCGIKNKMHGERYKQTKELALKYKNNLPKFNASGEYLVFKRIDKINENDNPEIVIFFAKPDVLSALFTLSNFIEENLTNVVSPFVSGCGSIIMFPSVERLGSGKNSYLGMFDISARPSVDENILSFSMSIEKFERMVNYMEESFLITESFDKVKERI